MQSQEEEKDTVVKLLWEIHGRNTRTEAMEIIQRFQSGGSQDTFDLRMNFS